MTTEGKSVSRMVLALPSCGAAFLAPRRDDGVLRRRLRHASPPGEDGEVFLPAFLLGAVGWPPSPDAGPVHAPPG